VALRCLIVDDNDDFLAAARDLLSRQGISVVGVASSGAEALERLGELQPDVTLIDVDLGDESGFDLARRFAETERGAPRVVLISTYAEGDVADLIAASHVAGFVSKSQLSGDAIRDLLERPLDGAP
jgi:DNA-binding NarL/FixJ family response regulator